MEEIEIAGNDVSSKIETLNFDKLNDPLHCR